MRQMCRKLTCPVPACWSCAKLNLFHRVATLLNRCYPRGNESLLLLLAVHLKQIYEHVTPSSLAIDSPLRWQIFNYYENLLFNQLCWADRKFILHEWDQNCL